MKKIKNDSFIGKNGVMGYRNRMKFHKFKANLIKKAKEDKTDEIS